ncbi:F0F1 ATP synthase subunit delta [Streptococcus pseudoporcinus]|uniref:ATP synthase subunit delta n=1 Tax=Streptococcus pseudoporcinus LQ 940-04 TaxID=875093 RepID=G5K6Q0_9STRE|nr:F0F1 ATP synthase subunit delta [Streptococcus pseudoporcinus]EFR44176.1 ATP synthase F1, delta subunit [Streptococcus pseudoporcinus SPIN 20026]EHI65927.1 ATP synthase F1, delta subunit [Streptococcus pseudoporcinus LQ 940-04]VEF94599.1 F0F1 ATP synthase subunit delta [Streptococcus pseudoporcinus]
MTKKEQALVAQYAKSLVEVAVEHEYIEDVKNNILTLMTVFESTELNRSLSSLAVPQAEKTQLVRLLKDTSSVYINNLLELIILNQREAFLFEILNSALREIEQVTNEYDVKVISTVPLNEEQKSRVKSLVTKKFGLQTGRLEEIIDESLIGGFIIQVNNKVIDTSIQQQLHEFKMKLI